MKIDRRRILKGSLAAPVVLTVRPASATAVTSAAACLNRCEARAKDYPPSKFSDASQSDEWMRVKVDVCRLSQAMGKPRYDGKYFLGFDQNTYWRLDDGDPYNKPSKVSNYTKGSCYEEKTGQSMYGVAYIDDQGSVVGFAWDNKHKGTPVTTSCYTSAVGVKYKA